MWESIAQIIAAVASAVAAGGILELIRCIRRLDRRLLELEIRVYPELVEKKER